MGQPKAKANPITIQKHLAGIDYPATRDDLLRHARGQNAPEEVIAALEQLTHHEYGSAADVAKGMGHAE